MTEKLLTPEAAAERLSIKPRTIREWLRNGRLKGVKMGRLWRVDEEEIKRLIEASKQG